MGYIGLTSCKTLCLRLFSWQRKYDARQRGRPTGELAVSTNGSFISVNEPPLSCRVA